MSNEDDKASVSAILRQAFPVREGPVTHDDLAQMQVSFNEKLQALGEILRLKIKNSEAAQRNWILTGCIAIMVAFGGGYVSIVSKLDRLNAVLPTMQITLETRRLWMQRQEQRDNLQDQALKQLDNSYAAMPYVEPPN